MAMQLFQFCLVSAVGFFFGPASALDSVSRALSIDPPLPLSVSLNQFTRKNVSLLFVKEPSDLIVVRGKDAILRCTVESTRGNATITWKYEGRQIPNDDTRWSLGSDGTELNIRHVAGARRATARGNAGEYACIARNEAGSILSRTAKVRLASMDKDVMVLPENLTLYESQPMLLHCSVHSIPSADVQWIYNQLPLPKDKRYIPLPNGALLIIDTKITDSGKYRCLAENTLVHKAKSSKDLEVTVLPRRANIPPSFLLLNASINRTVMIGETIDFFCIATGWPIPIVQWINNKNVTLSNSSNLTIRNADPKDAGNYTCIASNSLGRRVQKFHLDVYQKPFFNKTPSSKSLPSVQTVRLECQANGIPQPIVYWLKNGEPLVPDLRIKKYSSELVFSHTVSTDSGIYQCVAENPVGKIWAAAQIDIDSSQSPPPPQNLTCRPFDDDHICLTWKKPPNVPVKAFSVFSSYTTSEGTEKIGPDWVIQDTFQLVPGLQPSTNYSFYVMLYSDHASDHSETVTCQTGLKGSRNLDIDSISSTSVTLKWNKLSSDVLCNGTKDLYSVQWFRDGDDEKSPSIDIASERKFIVTGLVPAVDYKFRILTANNPRDEPWTMYTLPDIQETENVTSDPANELRAPKYLHVDSTSSTSVKISWDKILNAKFYTVCYVPAKEKRDCDDFTSKSYSPKFSVSKLRPNTEYLFKVRAHDENDAPGAMSQPLIIQTLSDVPSPVVNLGYKILNSSTACLHWRPPEDKNGKLKNYVVSYTTDQNWSLEHLTEYNVPVRPKKPQSCWEDEDKDGVVSTLLSNLSTDHTYMVMIRAANDVGVGQPFLPIEFKTSDSANNAKDEWNNPGEAEVASNQKVGVILGVILAALCIMCCITFILLRRRCLKRRAVARARLAVSSNYHPAVAHYTTQLGSVQVRMEDPCTMDEHEIEHLVSEEQISHIPPITPDHLDTKGASDFPNGHVNGTSKPKMNGTVLNGHVHITENPQYYAYECNGNMAKNKSEPLLRHYEEDSNSNVNPSKFHDFCKLFDGSRKLKGSPHHSPYGNGNLYSTSLDSSRDKSLDSTQMTFLDDSMASQRRLSPVLEPNG